jgi:hypothetical protein
LAYLLNAGFDLLDVVYGVVSFPDNARSARYQHQSPASQDSDANLHM